MWCKIIFYSVNYNQTYSHPISKATQTNNPVDNKQEYILFSPGLPLWIRIREFFQE